MDNWATSGSMDYYKTVNRFQDLYDRLLMEEKPFNKMINYKWRGITYPSFLYPFFFIWRKLFCKRGFHLFDEVLSGAFGHYLYCDACELVIPIHDDKKE